MWSMILIDWLSDDSLFLNCSSNDADELAEPEPEMDLEIQMAFKDFVKSQHQKW